MFVKNIDTRIKYILLIIVLLFLIIFLKVFYIQVISYQKLYSMEDDLISRELPIVAERGKILDRNGNVLATNITTSSIMLIPSQIKDKEKTAEILSSIIDVSYDEMLKHVNKNVSIERIQKKGRNLDSETADKIAKYNLKGVYLIKESKRYYPYDNLLSHVLGFTGSDNIGLSGVELLYNSYLAGEDGYIKYYSDAKGNRLEMSEVYEESSKGMDITLTIDIDIQKSIERELSNINDMFNPDGAWALAMDPSTGEILGMASIPSFNPNKYQNYSEEVINRNLAIWKTYEPGSTFKIITTAAAVEEGVVDLFNDTFYDPGKVKVSGATIRCWKGSGHGHQTYLQVFENSCNPGFVSLGFKLGKEKLFSYIDLFGFGEKTGIDLNGEGKGILFDLDNVHDLELATTAFGQGVSVTALQQVNAVSSIVNGGYLLKPYILKNITDSKTDTIYKENKTTIVRKTISEETSKTMRTALEKVVTNGGGKLVYIDGYRVGGKTGTAQKVENGRYLENNYIMSFMAVMPSNNPEVVLYLAIDNPKNTALLSSYTTTPFVRRILLDIITIMDIKKQDNQVEKEYEWYDKKYYDVSNVIGKTVKDAKKLLKNFNVSVIGDGDIVKEQSPSPNERLYEGGMVRLIT